MSAAPGASPGAVPAGWARRLAGNRTVLPFLALVLVWLVAAVTTDGFASWAKTGYLMQTASYLGIVGVGQTLVVLMGGIDLSVSGVVSLAAVACAQVATGYGGGAGIAAALGASALVGAANAFGVVTLRLPPLVMTLATGTIISGALLVYTNGSPRSASVGLLTSLANGKAAGVPLAFLLWLGIGLVCLWLLHLSRLGRQAVALGLSQPASRISGVSVPATSYAMYIGCSVLAGVAGLVLFGFTGTSSLTMGDPYQLQSIAVVVLGGTSILGGRGHVLGTVAGALMLTVLTSVLQAWNLSQAAQQVFLGALIVALLLVYAREGRAR